MNYKEIGNYLRNCYKKLVYDFMKSKEICQSYSDGMKQADIFRDCGMDWGDKANSTSSNQQYWTVAILRELEEENIIQRDNDTKKWRLK